MKLRIEVRILAPELFAEDNLCFYMPDIITKQTKYGQGVFAARPFAKGEKILEAKGPILDYDDFEDGSYEDEHCLQIGERTFLGSSGEVDDYVNHSCDPNAGYRVVGELADLIAIKDIGAGEQITYDYSTTMYNDANEMTCECGSLLCRGLIRDFQYLPAELQARYIALGIIPDFLIKIG